MSDSAGRPTPESSLTQPFSRAMIEDYLERRELRFTIDEDGDFRLDFVTEATQTLSVLLMADGADKNIFVINVIGTTMVPKTLWPTFIDFCNRWNTETRYPKSYLQIPADTDALFAAVHLEGQYPLGSGISQGLLDEFITTILSTSFAFWERVTEENLFDEQDETPND